MSSLTPRLLQLRQALLNSTAKKKQPIENAKLDKPVLNNPKIPPAPIQAPISGEKVAAKTSKVDHMEAKSHQNLLRMKLSKNEDLRAEVVVYIMALRKLGFDMIQLSRQSGCSVEFLTDLLMEKPYPASFNKRDELPERKEQKVVVENKVTADLPDEPIINSRAIEVIEQEPNSKVLPKGPTVSISAPSVNLHQNSLLGDTDVLHQMRMLMLRFKLDTRKISDRLKSNNPEVQDFLNNKYDALIATYDTLKKDLENLGDDIKSVRNVQESNVLAPTVQMRDNSSSVQESGNNQANALKRKFILEKNDETIVKKSKVVEQPKTIFNINETSQSKASIPATSRTVQQRISQENSASHERYNSSEPLDKDYTEKVQLQRTNVMNDEGLPEPLIEYGRLDIEKVCG